MVIASIAAFFQTLKEEDKPSYNKDELLVIAGGAAVIAGSFKMCIRDRSKSKQGTCCKTDECSSISQQSLVFIFRKSSKQLSQFPSLVREVLLP